MRGSLVQLLVSAGIVWLLSPAAAHAAPARPVLEIDAIVPSSASDAVPGAHTAALDTVWLADWSFDGPGGSCTEAGWVKYDNRILNDGSNYWSISPDYSGTGGITGRAAVLLKHDLMWCMDGYGNNWDYSIVLKYQGASNLMFSYLASTEPDFDFVSIEIDSLGLSEARVDYSVDPAATPSEFRTVIFLVSGLQSATVGPLALTDFGVPAGTHEVYIRFDSDGAYSAEDCLWEWPSFGAPLVVDNIAVSGMVSYTEDFEATLDPNVTFANTSPATPFGQWARLYPHLTDNNLCTENTTCAWLWTDPSRPALQPNMAFGPGGAVVRNWLDDVIVSPWVSFGSQPGVGSTFLFYRRFPGNDYAQSRIVQNWSVRSRVKIDNTDTSTPGDSIVAATPWAHASNWNTLTLFSWQSAITDMTSYVEPGASEIQVRFRVSDYQYIGGAAPPATLDPGPGPYIDRVRIGRVMFPGPTFEWDPSEFASQDGFPSERIASAPREDFVPTTDRFGTIDFASVSIDVDGWYPGPFTYNTRDSVVASVHDARGLGVTSVGIDAAIIAGPHAGKAPPPWSVGANGFFHVPADSVRDRSGVPIPGHWFVDLDDEYFRGGDVLVYFWSATDGGGGFTSLPPGLAAAPSSIAEAQQATGGLLETSYLPTIDWDPGYRARIAADPSGKLAPTPEEIANSHQSSCILYYRMSSPPRLSGPAHRSAFMHTLDQLGYQDLYDVYYQTTLFLSYSTHLAGRATPEQAGGYSLIIEDTGTLPGSYLIPPGGLRDAAIDQQTWYRSWLAQAATSASGRATLWLIGENLADDAILNDNPLVLGDMGVTRTTSSQTLLPYPNIVGQGTFTWAHGGSTDFTGDLVTLNSSGCTLRGNDGMGATGTAVVTHRYTLGSTAGDGAAVMNANPAESWNSLLMAFAWDDLLDVPGTPPGNRRADLMAEVLNGVLPDSCRAGANPSAVPDDPAALPRTTALHANVPNPFNPTTTIGFDLARSARVRLEIFDVSGRRVRSLVDEWRDAGWNHRVTWNGLDASGQRVASGIYLYRLVAGEVVSTRKMIVLK